MVTFLEVRVYFFVAETLDALTSAIHSSCEQQPLRLETIGVDRLSGATDWITLSPKRHRPPRPEVVAAQAPQAHWLLQPGWDCEEGLQLAVSKVQQDQRWRLSMQSHKWLGVR